VSKPELHSLQTPGVEQAIQLTSVQSTQVLLFCLGSAWKGLQRSQVPELHLLQLRSMDAQVGGLSQLKRSSLSFVSLLHSLHLGGFDSKSTSTQLLMLILSHVDPSALGNYFSLHLEQVSERLESFSV